VYTEKYAPAVGFLRSSYALRMPGYSHFEKLFNNRVSRRLEPFHNLNGYKKKADLRDLISLVSDLPYGNLIEEGTIRHCNLRA
jgi:hypothetical protein